MNNLVLAYFFGVVKGFLDISFVASALALKIQQGVAKDGMLRLHYLHYGCVVLAIDDIPYLATPGQILMYTRHG